MHRYTEYDRNNRFLVKRDNCEKTEQKGLRTYNVCALVRI